jgi:hypothetical protein
LRVRLAGSELNATPARDTPLIKEWLAIMPAAHRSKGTWPYGESVVRRRAAAGLLQPCDEIVELAQPSVPFDVRIPIVAQLAFHADALDRSECLVDLGVMRLMRMSVDPVAHMIGQASGCVTGTGRQLRGRDRFARPIDIYVPRLAHGAVKR